MWSKLTIIKKVQETPKYTLEVVILTLNKKVNAFSIYLLDGNLIGNGFKIQVKSKKELDRLWGG